MVSVNFRWCCRVRVDVPGGGGSRLLAHDLQDARAGARHLPDLVRRRRVPGGRRVAHPPHRLDLLLDEGAEALVPPRVDDGVDEAVAEAEDGERARDQDLDGFAPSRAGVVAVHVQERRDEVGAPRDGEAARGEQHHLDGLPLAGVVDVVLRPLGEDAPEEALLLRFWVGALVGVGGVLGRRLVAAATAPEDPKALVRLDVGAGGGGLGRALQLDDFLDGVEEDDGVQHHDDQQRYYPRAHRQEDQVLRRQEDEPASCAIPCVSSPTHPGKEAQYAPCNKGSCSDYDLPGVQVTNLDFTQQMVHQNSLCYKDWTMRHFVVSSTSVRRARVINWKSVCVVSCRALVFNMSKFIPNEALSRTALIFCFHLKKTAAESYREACGEHAPSSDMYE